MEKKKLGIKLIAFSMFYYVIMGIYRFIVWMSFFLSSPPKIRTVSMLRYSVTMSFLTFLLSIFIAIVAIGVMRLKRWAYYSLICVAIIMICSSLFEFIRVIPYGLRTITAHPLGFIELGIALVYFSVVIYYLTRPKVKEQFK